MTTTPNPGTADLPDAIHMAELLENPINVVCQKTAAAVLRHQQSELERLHAFAAGQATAAQAVVQDDLITIRKPTTSAEMLWLLKLAHLVISDVDKTLEETFAPAQPAQTADSQLLQFYGVTTDAELIAAQAAHIEKLQAKLTKTPSFAPQRVREG